MACRPKDDHTSANDHHSAHDHHSSNNYGGKYNSGDTDYTADYGARIRGDTDYTADYGARIRGDLYDHYEGKYDCGSCAPGHHHQGGDELQVYHRH